MGDVSGTPQKKTAKVAVMSKDEIEYTNEKLKRKLVRPYKVDGAYCFRVKFFD
jgi:hypothetical protein